MLLGEIIGNRCFKEVSLRILLKGLCALDFFVVVDSTAPTRCQVSYLPAPWRETDDRDPGNEVATAHE